MNPEQDIGGLVRRPPSVAPLGNKGSKKEMLSASSLIIGIKLAVELQRATKRQDRGRRIEPHRDPEMSKGSAGPRGPQRGPHGPKDV